MEQNIQDKREALLAHERRSTFVHTNRVFADSFGSVNAQNPFATTHPTGQRISARGYIARRPYGIVHDEDSAEEEEADKLLGGLDELGKEMMSGATAEQRLSFKREIEVAAVKKNGAIKTFFTLMKGFIASAVLFLPKGFRNGGWLFSTISLTCSALLTYFCAMLLIRIRQKYKGFSLSEIGR